MTDDRLSWFPCYPSKLLGALAAMQPTTGYIYWIVCLRIYELNGPCNDPLNAWSRRTGYNKRIVSDALDELFRAGKLVRTPEGITNPFAEQVIADSKAKHQKRVSAGGEGGKRSAEKRQTNQSPPPSNASPKSKPIPPQLQEQLFPNGNNSPRPAARKSDWPSDYRDQFWARYPRKTEKKAAMPKLDAVARSGDVSWEDFSAGLDRHVAQCRGREARYIKHPTTWLNRGCWEDEPDPPGGGERQASQNGKAAAAIKALREDAQQRRGGRDDGEPNGLGHPGGEVIPAGSTRGDHATVVHARRR